MMKDCITHINPMHYTDVSSLREVLVLVLNVVEEQSHLIDILKQENQELKDEINRLKKEQGVPVFPISKKDKKAEEVAS